MTVFVVVCQENRIYHVIVEFEKKKTKPIEMKISTNVTKFII